MADQLQLARSFYTWAEKVYESENYEVAVLPAFYKTDSYSLMRISEDVHANLVGTQYEARALYWRGIFENFQGPQIINEAAFDSFIRVLATVMGTGPAEPQTNRDKRSFIKRAIEAIMREDRIVRAMGIRKFGSATKKNALHRLMSRGLTVAEEDALAQMEGGIVNPESLLGKVIQTGKGIWNNIFGLLGNVKVWLNLAVAGADVLAYAWGLIGYAVDKLFGSAWRNKLINELKI